MAAINSTSTNLTVTDYRTLVKELRKVEPGVLKQMRTNIRRDAEPLRDGIRKSIPGSAPARGMVTPIGRLSWGRGKRADSVTYDFRPPRKSVAKSLVKLVVGSPATVLADMAGKSGRYIGSRVLAGATKANSMPVTSGKYKGEMGYAYTYRNGVKSGRIHRNTGGQGRGLIRGLGIKPSRYVWPAAERALPTTRKMVGNTVDTYIDFVNSKLRTK